MVSGKKFSTAIVLFLMVFTSVSLVSITFIVYSMRSHSARKETLTRFEARTVELAGLLRENLGFLLQRAEEVASDPSVAAHLRSGDTDFLSRLAGEEVTKVDGVHIVLYDSNTGRYIPDVLKTFPGIESYLETSVQPEPENIRFHRVGGALLTIFSSPVMDGSAQIGTCFIVFNFVEDTRFYSLVKSMGQKDSSILFHDGGEDLFDAETGKPIALDRKIEVPSDFEKRAPLPEDFLPEKVMVPLGSFPGFYYVGSISSLLQQNRSFLVALISMSIAVFCLISIASVLLAKMVTKPLEVIAAETFETAKAPTDRFLSEERTGYVEFRQIARAFNQVLENLLDLQQKFKLKAKRELDASEERYRLTLEAAPDSITINSLGDGRFIQVNEAFLKTTGYSREEIIGKSNEALDLFVDPSDLEHLIEAVRRRGGINGFEARTRRKDGALIHAVLSARKLDFEGEACIISVVSDRTAQKKAEEEQTKLAAALQRASKMEAIGTMAGGVAHDLNNILSGLVSYPELLLMDLPEDSPLRPAVLTIQKSGQRAAAIVQDMLTLARRGVPVTEVVNINDIVREYLKSPEHQGQMLHGPRVRVQVDLASETMNIIGSDVHISKSLMNLVSNSIEAMPDGGALCITTRNQYVDVPIRKYDTVVEGDYVVLEVSDSGTGISREDQERIFEPFYTKKKMGRSGTGLGMAVVWGTVKDHNGYIDLESRQGVGTTFTLYFPATRSEFVTDKPRIPLDEYRGRGEAILVVDDVAEQRNIAAGILKRLGYTVTTVASGEEAIEYLKTIAVDLLVLDMVMEPGMDGLETYRRVLVHNPGQKAIIASGFSETDRVREAQRLGAGPYVRKPYLIQNIGISVREELDRPV